MKKSFELIELIREIKRPIIKLISSSIYSKAEAKIIEKYSINSSQNDMLPSAIILKIINDLEEELNDQSTVSTPSQLNQLNSKVKKIILKKHSIPVKTKEVSFQNSKKNLGEYFNRTITLAPNLRKSLSERILLHEYGHLIVDANKIQHIPNWTEEGLVEGFSRNLAKYFTTNTILESKLTQLVDLNTFENNLFANKTSKIHAKGNTAFSIIETEFPNLDIYNEILSKSQTYADFFENSEIRHFRVFI